MRSLSGTRIPSVPGAHPRLALIAVLAFAAPALSAGDLAGQSPGAGTPTVAPAEFQAVLAEYRAAQQQFTALHDQAFRSNQGLRDQETALNELILRAMGEEIPGADGQIARLDSLRLQAMQAQQAQDATRLDSIMNEAGALQTRLQMARDQVMERTDVQARVQTLEAELMRTMLGIDPGAQALMNRLDQLVAILNAGPGGG